ncbi:MAG: glycosyltransferase family 39 protein [Candidatus Binatia bacterium]
MSTAARLGRHWPLAALLGGAGAVYARTCGAYGMLTWDEAEYASLARSLVRGAGYTFDGPPHPLRPPLLPLAEAASLWWSGRADDAAVHAASVGLALLALALLYAGAALAYDRATGLVAAALLASAPWFWTTTANALSELPLLAFFAAALFAWSAGLLRDARWFYVSWSCFGLALLTRYTALLFGPLAALLALAELVRGDAAVRARVASRAFVLAPLVGLAVVAPWFARQALVFGDPLVGVREAAGQLQRYLPGVAMPWWQYLADLPAMLSWPTLALAVVGAATALRRGERFGVHALVTAAFVLAWFSVYRYKEPRLVSAMMPAAALLAARGLIGSGAGVGPSAAIVAAIGVLNLGATRPVFANVRTLGYPSFLAAMAFVRAHSTPDARLVGPNEPQIVWYADRAAEGFGAEAGLDAQLARAEWVVVTDFERGQPPYVAALAKRLPAEAFADGSAVRFHAGGFTTLLVRAPRFRQAAGL